MNLLTPAPMKIALTSFTTTLVLTLSVTIPSQTAEALVPEEERTTQIQQLRTHENTLEQNIPVDIGEIEVSQEWLIAQEAARVAEENRIKNENTPQVFRDVPSGVGAQGLVAAALAQLGVQQDCTDLVQNSLAAIGLTERRENGGYDLGTGIWQYDRYGTRVDISQLAPGDILVYGNAGSGTHVAIYIGDGQAVHGGYSNNTVIAGVHTAGHPLTGAIRV